MSNQNWIPKIVYRLPKFNLHEPVWKSKNPRTDDVAYVFLEHNMEPLLVNTQPYYPQYLTLAEGDSLSLVFVITNFDVNETSLLSVAIIKKCGEKLYFNPRDLSQLYYEYSSMVVIAKGHQVQLFVGMHLDDGDIIQIEFVVMPGFENCNQLLSEAATMNNGVISTVHIPIRVE